MDSTIKTILLVLGLIAAGFVVMRFVKQAPEKTMEMVEETLSPEMMQELDSLVNPDEEVVDEEMVLAPEDEALQDALDK